MKFDAAQSKSPLVRHVLFCTHKERRGELAGRLHAHARFAREMIYVDYGVLRLYLEETPIVIQAGECVFIRGKVRHSLESEAGTPIDFLNLMFRGSVPDALFNRSMVLGPYGLSLVERLSRETRDALPYHYDRVVATLTELIIHLLRQVPGALGDRRVEPAYLRHHHSGVVKRALSVIGQHYAEPLTLKQTCRAVGVSESYLHVLLTKETGATFTQLLQRSRVEAAKHLLLDSPMPLTRIVAAVGYHSSSSFFKVFKRETGKTPAAYARGLGDPARVSETADTRSTIITTGVDDRASVMVKKGHLKRT